MSELRHQEIIDRVHHMYLQTDGTIEFPNSFEGDLLKIAYGTAVQSIKQPQLNENQQIVLDWLKESCKLNGLREVIEIMGFLSTTGGKMKYKQVAYAYGDLNDDELKHVLQAFSRWAIEQEEG
ncbi:hypothetical protein EB52_02407 [Enterococcus faecalis]|uniref:hypothetical protein n=1 Tax=Enterococcus faecalis TaxID=1351 RepID=UPI000DEAC5B4|nr:hypothetical protein [Enterococcus faecalis]EGO6739191.1 hypothetical protein [Enterococcus faecalis]RBR74171.1 hypothetical protein EB52_02407 [Enterococcus faecalis]